MGASGEAAFQSFINGITATDPAMTEMLQSMGLIEEKMNADGTYSVNLDGLEGAISDMDRLTASIVALIDLMDDDVLNGSFSLDTADAEAGIETVTGLMRDVDGRVVTATIQGDGTGGARFVDELNTIDGLTRDLDGRVVRTAIQADTQDAAGRISEVDGIYRELDGRVMRLAVEADTEQVQSSITETINALGGLDGSSANVTLSAVDNASGVFRDADGVIRSIDGTTATATFSAVDGVSGVASTVRGSVASVSGKTVTLAAIDSVSGIAGNAIGAIGGLSGKTVTLGAENLISGAVSAAQRAIDSLRGRTVTTTMRTIYESRGIGPTRQAHGGIAGYALGGNVVPIWAAEAGPELAHFPAGGVAMLPREGAYSVPQGTYIEPGNSVSARGSSPMLSLTIPIYGNVYGIDDLTEQVMRQMAPALERASEAFGRGMGIV